MAPKLNPQESGQRILASPCHLSFPTDFSPKDTGNLSHCSASYQLTTTKHFKKALEEEMGEREKKKPTWEIMRNVMCMYTHIIRVSMSQSHLDRNQTGNLESLPNAFPHLPCPWPLGVGQGYSEAADLLEAAGGRGSQC